MGDQVGKEARCAKFGAYPSTGVFRGYLHLSNYHSFLYICKLLELLLCFTFALGYCFQPLR